MANLRHYIPGPRKIRRLAKEAVLQHKERSWKRQHAKEYADKLYLQAFGQPIQWEAPRNLNEWINRLAFLTDTHMWSRLADKYEVRHYVAEKGLEQWLLPLYGVWKRASKIDFSTLPNSFAIKTNQGSGDTLLVEDKAACNEREAKRHLRQAMRARFGIESAEPHYLRIKPLIICEKLLPPPCRTDYKIWCFHGQPCCVFVVAERNIATGHALYSVYSPQWEPLDDWLQPEYRNGKTQAPPPHLADMLDAASRLSAGFPQVRVDFYDTPEQAYFGEMTFTSACGRMQYFSDEAQTLMGQRVAAGFHKEIGDKHKISPTP